VSVKRDEEISNELIKLNEKLPERVKKENCGIITKIDGLNEIVVNCQQGFVQRLDNIDSKKGNNTQIMI
jgi:hypothetical protein